MEWLVKWSFVRSGEEAKVLGRALLLEGHIKMVNMHTLERTGSFSCHNTDRGDIVDSRSQFYIFVGCPHSPPHPLPPLLPAHLVHPIPSLHCS